MLLTQEKNTPNLELKRTQENKMSHLGYKSYEDRVFDLASLFKNSLDEEYTKTIGSNVYVSRDFKDPWRETELIFNGIYRLEKIELYMGLIPEKNQIEISEKMKILRSNPFLKQKFTLKILAPLNNFASESNISAIDPIAFAYFEDDKYCYRNNFLIYLSQWI